MAAAGLLIRFRLFVAAPAIATSHLQLVTVSPARSPPFVLSPPPDHDWFVFAFRHDWFVFAFRLTACTQGGGEDREETGECARNRAQELVVRGWWFVKTVGQVHMPSHQAPAEAEKSGGGKSYL